MIRFKSFNWLSHHGLWPIKPCSKNMVSVFCPYIIKVRKIDLYFGAFLIKQLFYWLAFAGYEMIIANSALRSSLAIYNLHPRSWNNCLLFYNDVPTFIAYCGVKWSRLLIYQGSPEYCDQRKLTGKVLTMKLLLIVLTYRLKLSWEKIDFKKNSPFQDSTFYILYHFLSEIDNKNKWIEINE